MLALIDGDLAAYRASAATQKSIDWGDGGGASVYSDPAEAIKAALETIRLWALAAGGTKTMVFLTGKGNFRKSIYPAYKSNRAGVERPHALKAVQEAIRDEFKTVSVDGLEADDLLGMTLTTPNMAGRAVCVSMDKDLRTVPGLHFNPAKDTFPVHVTEAEANRWWFTQALTGDASDGYPGCRKIGPVKAERLLADWDGLDIPKAVMVVSETFSDAGHTYGEFLQMMRVARILRFGDYRKSTREVLMWDPIRPERLKLP